MIIDIRAEDPDKRKLATVVECLRDGGVIVYPTDTVYAFGCDIFNSRSLERVARIKGIRTDKADFSIVCHDLSDLAAYSRQLDNHVFKMMKSLLPGPYTFILDAGKNIPKIFSERKKTIGIRVPDHKVSRELVMMMGNPLIASSVHDEDAILEYTSDSLLIHENIGHLVDMVINSGPGGLEPSTVISCRDGVVSLVRAGKGMEAAGAWL